MLRMPLIARKGVLAIAAVIDIAIHRGRPLSAKALAVRHGVPARHFEPLLQALARHGIVRGIRGPHGGYKLARERSRISADQIAEAAGMAEDDAAILHAPSQVLNAVVMPALGAAERAFSAALARITLDDLVRRAQNVVKPSGSTELPLLSNSDRDARDRIGLLAPMMKREADENWGRWPSTKASGSNR
jgi:Rrf2 family transcriptional regulator, iron-sulfur cluster assembly transcription factor